MRSRWSARTRGICVLAPITLSRDATLTSSVRSVPNAPSARKRTNGRDGAAPKNRPFATVGTAH